MSHRKWLGTGVAALLVGSSLMVAQAASTGRSTKLNKPWSELKDLSEDQTTKIKSIHEKALDQIHEIESKEKTEIMALLTDAQKKELDQAIALDKKEAAERAAARRTGKTASATTKPSSAK